MDPRRRLLLRGALQEARQAEIADVPRPPWALDDDLAFTQRCTRCSECVRACPEHILVAGDGGFPSIDFANGGCTLCGECVDACPTGALTCSDGHAAFTWRIQKSNACLNDQRVECRICVDACDVRALRWQAAPGGIGQLFVDREACTGCGACLAPCPVSALSLVEP